MFKDFINEDKSLGAGFISRTNNINILYSLIDHLKDGPIKMLDGTMRTIVSLNLDGDIIPVSKLVYDDAFKIQTLAKSQEKFKTLHLLVSDTGEAFPLSGKQGISKDFIDVKQRKKDKKKGK